MTDMMLPPDAMMPVGQDTPQDRVSPVYRDLMQKATESFLILDRHTILDCNPAAARLFGLDCAQLVNTSVLAHCPVQQASGQTSDQAWDDIVQRVGDAAPLRCEWLFRRADGTLITAEVAFSCWQQHESVWILLNIHDTDHRSHIESALLTKQLELQILLDNFPGGISIVDNSLRFVAWNKELLRLTGFDETVFCPERPPGLIDIFRMNIERGEYGELSPDLTKEQYLARWVARAGLLEAHLFERTRPNGMVLEVRGVPMENGGFVSIYQDVTEQHRIKQELQKQSVLLQEILEHMSTGITVFDENLHLKIWNSGVAEMLNLPVESFKPGVAYEDLLRIMLERGEFGAVDVEQELQKRMALVRQFRDHRYERTGLSGRTFLIHGKSVLHEEKIAEFITTLTEITDRKQAENALQDANTRLERLVRELNDARADLVRSEKLVALGSLVAGVAHELNTPLGNCLMMASSMQELTSQINARVNHSGITKTGLIDYFNQVEDAMSLLSRNLNSAGDLILRFKQVAITETSSQRTSFRLDEVANEVASITRNKVQDGGHHLLLEIESDLEMHSYFVPLVQVLVNFVNNSVLHAFHGMTGGTMHFSARRIDAQRVLIEFRDDGCGIEKKNLGRIFDPFFTTRMGQGSTGLGLQISHNIITSLLGGEIGVHSEPGAGTTFTVHLPLHAPYNQ